jgi:hypothetical protein
MTTTPSLICTSSFDVINSTKNGDTTNYVIIDGDTLRITGTRTISPSITPSYKGEICKDSNYIYLATNTNIWKRLHLLSF